MVIYVVKSGDTIFSIAEQYGIPAEEIISYNQLSNPEQLVVGQTILVPTGENIADRELAVNGYMYPYIETETLTKTVPYLTFGTVFTYGFTPEGELIPIPDERVIGIMKSGNTAPILLLSTLTKEGGFSNSLAHSIFINLEAQDKLIENLINTMESKGYYGLDIDFEYVLQEDREAYGNFVERVTKAMHQAGYKVMVALAPKTSADQPGLLYESHDYGRLGGIADWVLLMTYEWGYTYGPPMAVSPINKVRQVLDYAVTEIPPEKIFMGIPNYGYDWTLPYIKGESRAKSVSNVGAVSLAQKYGAVIKFDETSQAPFFTYFDQLGTEHIVWFEDARSIQAKLDLIKEYGFFGAGYWNIMNFFPQNWLVVENNFTIKKVE